MNTATSLEAVRVCVSGFAWDDDGGRWRFLAMSPAGAWSYASTPEMALAGLLTMDGE